MRSALHRCIGDLVDLEVEFESAFISRPVVKLGVVGFDAAHESGHADLDKEDVAALRFKYNSSPIMLCMYTT